MNILNYKVVAQIYDSNNSQVYRAIREEDKQPVILKILKEDYPTPEELTRYRQEYDMMHRLTDLQVTGITQVYQIEKYQNSLMISLEDFGGQSLKMWLAEHTFTLNELLTLAIQTCDILGQIHAQQVIHKDINPANLVWNASSETLKIIDFGISTQLSKQHLTLKNPDVLEGTLAYISPEQTGRMNRVLDYRTDFYSLGVTCYLLFTSKLPFDVTDAMEIVHCHIAKQPLPPVQINSNIPLAISNIILKLLEKNAEDRYQSAWGIKADLEICQRQLENTGTISAFPLAQKDVSDRFQIPQKLYGREFEVKTLYAGFERAVSGRAEIMLVAGYSGIGKSVLVKEIYKSLTEKPGYFIAGKFDQFQRNVPYSAMVNAFKELVQQLLTENEEQLAVWKKKLLIALSTNGKVITDVLPEIERIIGKQPEIPQLGPSESQTRFNLVFQNFMSVFCQPVHPLVLFLDDLQWADSATLKLLELVIEESAALFLIGAYRDNEVDPTHPLVTTLDKLRENNVAINQITLKPLDFEHINQLIADSLHQTLETTGSLTDLVMRKTNGNPFFVNQFLHTLYEENLLQFIPPSGEQKSYWQWDIEEIEEINITDNVVDLMVGKLKKLPEASQCALRLASCVGNHFDVTTLSIIYEKTVAETFQDLMPILSEGLLLPKSEPEIVGDELHSSHFIIHQLQFLHDRVQQAAYALINETQKQKIHLKTAHLLLENTPTELLEEKVFDIVGQFNHSVGLLANQAEQLKVARLNLIAGQKAKMATAYGAAVNYLNVGRQCLTENCWESEYDLSFNLYLEALEAAYLCTQFEQIDTLANIVLCNAKSALDKAKVNEIQIQRHISQNQMQEALALGLETVKMLGVSLLESKPQNITIEKLYNLPEMSDPEKLMVLRILRIIFPPAQITNPPLVLSFAFTMVQLCHDFGNSPLAAYSYTLYGLILCGPLGEIETGYQFGKLALTVSEQFESPEIECEVICMFNFFIRHWKEALSSTVEPLPDNVQLALETGNVPYISYTVMLYCQNLVLIGQSLSTTQQKQKDYICLVQKFKQTYQLYNAQIWGQLVLNLTRKVQDKFLLSGEMFDENEVLPLLLQAKSGTTLFRFYLAKTMLCYLLGDFKSAIENGLHAETYEKAVKATVLVTHNPFYYSLALLACYPTATEDKQKDYLEKVKINQEKLQTWAVYAPMNLQHKYDLIEAEKARILGQSWAAAQLYERAIEGAKINQYLHEEAISYELAGQFYLAENLLTVAKMYLREAHYAYQRWGATIKVEDLVQKYPQLLVTKTNTVSMPKIEATILSTRMSSASTKTDSSTQWLDLGSVMKASQTLSGEIVLGFLLEKMMEIVIENAGAEKGFLLLPKGEQWFIEAEGNVNSTGIKVLQSLPIEDSQDLANTLIIYVVRTQDSVVLNNASTEGHFMRDPHIIREKTKSVLAMPLLNQGKLVGILYLENNLAEGAFTTNRIETLKMLSSQIAISIQNAKLYAEVRENEKTLRQFLEAIPVGIGILDNLGKPHFVNQRGQELLGRGLLQDTETQQIAESYELYVAQTEQVYPTEKLPIVRALQGERTSVDNIEVHQNEKVVPLESWGTPIFDDQNNVLYAMSAFQDISERKQAEADKIRLVQEQEAKNVALRYSAEIEEKNTELAKTLTQLKETQSQLVESEKMASLGNLVAGVAHEINTPVGVGVTAATQLDKITVDFANLYKEGNMARTDLEQYLNAVHQTGGLILKNLTRAAELTKSFKQVAVDQASERQRTFVLLDYINEILFSLKPKLKPTGYEILVDCDENIKLKTYAGAFAQVMTNLIMNSMQHGFAGIKEGQIKIAVIEKVEQLVIHYSDDGKGIASENIDKIFEPFFTTNRQGGGTGLGLHIAYNLVTHKLKGTIHCQSELGKGVLFTLNLPLSEIT